MSYYEPAWDDEGNPEVGVWVKEEPDCFECSDTGRRDNGRRCANCDPNRWQILWALARWQVYRANRRVRVWLGRPVRDEAPF